MLIKKYRIPLFQLITVGLLPCFAKKWFYRIKGYHIGKGVSLGIGSVIIGKNVKIGDFTNIGFFTVIRANVIFIDRYVYIGAMTFMDTERIEIGEDTRIREQVYVGGLSDKDSLFKIGKRCLIMQMTYINPTRPVILGDDSAIGGFSQLFTHSSWLSVLDGYPVNFGPITIGKKVWLPFKTFITSNVTIGDEVIIAPNTVINQNIPSKSMAHGHPLKILPNIYAKPLPYEKRKEKIFNIVDEFCEYLKYYDYKVYKEDMSKYTKITVKRKRNKHYLIICELFDSSIKNIKGLFSLFLLNTGFSKEIELIKNIEMIMSLLELKRFGSSNMGEEFIRFLSRYGIRFARVDE